VPSLGGSENAINQAFSSQVPSLGGSENAIKRAFLSQVPSLGGSENAIKRAFLSQVGLLGESYARAGLGMCSAQHRLVLSEEIVQPMVVFFGIR